MTPNQNIDHNSGNSSSFLNNFQNDKLLVQTHIKPSWFRPALINTLHIHLSFQQQLEKERYSMWSISTCKTATHCPAWISKHQKSVVAKTVLRIHSCKPTDESHPYAKTSELCQMISFITQKAVASAVKERADNDRRFLRNLRDL